MGFLVVLIVNEPKHVAGILEKWESIGIRGITILESSGHGRIKRAGLLENIPIITSLENLEEISEVHHRTLFSVVEQENLVDRMAEAAQEVIGDLNEEHTGFFFVVPVLKAIGLQHRPNNS
ncbi:MAG: P-II family nitrogen regulator [Anaerolineales bacterium]